MAPVICIGLHLLCPGASGDVATNAPTVVVTATRDARLLQDVPYATSVLSADALRLEQAVRTVPEALGDEPSLLIQKTGHGQGSPYIR